MTARLHPSVKLAHRAWGPGVHRFTGRRTALEGHPAVSAEYAIHDLCHAALLTLPVRYGRCRYLEMTVAERINELPDYQQELHEVRAASAELLVLQELDLLAVVEIEDLYSMFRSNSVYLSTRSRLPTASILSRTQGRALVRCVAGQVLSFVRNREPWFPGKGPLWTQT